MFGGQIGIIGILMTQDLNRLLHARRNLVSDYRKHYYLGLRPTRYQVPGTVLYEEMKVKIVTKTASYMICCMLF